MRRTYSVCQSECTSSFHAAPNILYLCFLIANEIQPIIQLVKVFPGYDFETGHDAFSGKILDRFDRSMFRGLDLERTFSESESLDFRHPILHACLEYDIMAREAQINISVSNERGYVCGGEEDAMLEISDELTISVRDGYLQSNRMVHDQTYIEPVGPQELDIGAYVAGGGLMKPMGVDLCVPESSCRHLS